MFDQVPLISILPPLLLLLPPPLAFFRLYIFGEKKEAEEKEGKTHAEDDGFEFICRSLVG